MVLSSAKHFNSSVVIREAEVDGSNTEHNVHISVLANDQTLDIYKCTDPSCEHFCTKTNKRYHCPLCNNKPQKPGRMRRHFEKMHSSKQIVQHGGNDSFLFCQEIKGLFIGARVSRFRLSLTISFIKKINKFRR